MMNKDTKKIIAIGIIGASLGTNLVPLTAYADTITNEKEEVIYVNLDGDGNIDGTYAVNIFDNKDIIDYGDYSSVKNMNTNDEINYKDGMVSINNTADKLYYEGVMDNVEIPWNVEITYNIDGKTYSAKDVAGKTGKLTMEIVLTKNENAKEGFFDNYALQTVVQLDTSKCTNIVSEGATTANVGNLKQLSYTVMPGNEKRIVINSDVTNFEMESVAINGVKLSLGLDKSSIDSSELTEEIKKLQDAVSELDSGANDLNNGAETLNSGAISLSTGITTMNEALNLLNSKSGELVSGSSEVNEALKTIQSALSNVNISVNDLQTLSSASTEIKNGISSLVSGLQTMDGSIDEYNSQLNKAGLNDINSFVDSHNSAIEALAITSTQRNLYNAYISSGQAGVLSTMQSLVQCGDAEATALYSKVQAGDSNAITEYVTLASKLISVEALLKADISYIQGSNKLISGIDSALDSNGELMKGALLLDSKYNEFDSKIKEMVSSLENLAMNMSSLKGGIDKLTNNYGNLDYGIEEYTNAVDTITNSYSLIYDGAVKMASGTSALYGGTNTLVSGTSEFKEETSSMDDKIDAKIDEMIDEFSGSDFEVKSFVSDKNTNVESVQFVIKTESVKIIDNEVQEETKTEELNIWQKFLKLFGLN